MIQKTGCIDCLGMEEFGAISNSFAATEVQKRFGKDPVAREKIMHAVRSAVTRLAGVDDEYAPPAARQHDRRIEPRRTGADDDHVVFKLAVAMVLHWLRHYRPAHVRRTPNRRKVVRLYN